MVGLVAQRRRGDDDPRRVRGVSAILAFAPGRGGRANDFPNQVCAPHTLMPIHAEALGVKVYHQLDAALRETLARFGERVRSVERAVAKQALGKYGIDTTRPNPWDA